MFVACSVQVFFFAQGPRESRSHWDHVIPGQNKNPLRSRKYTPKYISMSEPKKPTKSKKMVNFCVVSCFCWHFSVLKCFSGWIFRIRRFFFLYGDSMILHSHGLPSLGWLILMMLFCSLYAWPLQGQYLEVIFDTSSALLWVRREVWAQN